MKSLVVLLFLASCTINTPAPTASPSPEPSPVYPASGWHSDYDKFLKDGFLAHATVNLRSMCKVPITEEMWVTYWKTIVSLESSYNRATQFVEPGTTKDRVTGKALVSEGLFQLSYADELGYPGCDFDWAKDKNLPAKELTKTIFDATRQFKCAMAISKKLFEKYPNGHPTWGNPLGAYWSTAREKSTKARARLKANLPQCF